MINVLQRLAEIDSQNPNVVQAKPQINPDAAVEAVQRTLSEELSVDSLRYLSGLKETLEECGMMPGMPTGMPASTPASFSINASAATGDEVASMLTNIMTLAGMHKVGAEHMPAQEPKAMSTVPSMSSGDDMKRMLDVMNEPPADDADSIGDEGLAGAAGGAMLGGAALGPLGAVGGGLLGSELEDSSEPDAGSSEVDIAGVGGALAGAALGGDAASAADGMDAGKDATYSGGEDMRKLIDAVSGPGYDNAGADSNEIAGPGDRGEEVAYDPNSGSGVGRGTAQPSAKATAEDITHQLFSEYEKFVTESKKCNHSEKGEKCPVHGMKECSGMYEALKGGQKKLDVDDDGDIEADDLADLRAKKVKEEKFDPLKHIKNPTQGEKDAAKLVKRSSYGDRAALNKSAENDGRLGEAEKTMSRAAKGHEKYGKAGMAALAKAGKEGKSLEPVRAKYNKYD